MATEQKRPAGRFVGKLIDRKDGSTVLTTGACKTWDGAWKAAASKAPHGGRADQYTCRVEEIL